MRRAWPALLVVPVLLLLAGCVGGAPKPEPTPLTPGQACAALEGAVADFYDVASPGSSITELPNYDLPTIKDFRIPHPTCAFQVRPDPAVVPGDAFTIEAFYLDYDEEMTVTLPASLEAAGFKKKDPNFSTWSSSKLGRSYSAAMLLFQLGDGQAYTEAVEHFRILDLSIGQN